MTNQSYYRELFLQYSHLIRLLQIVDLMENTLATLVENRTLDCDVQRENARHLAQIVLHAGLQNITSRYIPECPEDLTRSIHLQQVLKQSRSNETCKIAAADALRCATCGRVQSCNLLLHKII